MNKEVHRIKFPDDDDYDKHEQQAIEHLKSYRTLFVNLGRKVYYEFSYRLEDISSWSPEFKDIDSAIHSLLIPDYYKDEPEDSFKKSMYDETVLALEDYKKTLKKTKKALESKTLKKKLKKLAEQKQK